MNKLRNILDKIPALPLALIAIMMALTPFYPAPHLAEKLTMLANSTLTKPIDIFDLFMHGFPLILLILKVFLGKPKQNLN